MLSGDLPFLIVFSEFSQKLSQETLSKYFVYLAISSQGTSDLCLPSQETHLLLILFREVPFLPVCSDYSLFQLTLSGDPLFVYGLRRRVFPFCFFFFKILFFSTNFRRGFIFFTYPLNGLTLLLFTLSKDSLLVYFLRRSAFLARFLRTLCFSYFFEHSRSQLMLSRV